MDDWQLLKDYAARNSEEAFRALVDRYAGMVYHAALRQSADPHSAEEAAQVVFITLARKAGSIPRQATLYGWLFRATRFAVLNQARQQATRERREQEARAMQPMTESNDADSLWERITPHLNDALDKLSAADRELVMVRYFGNQSYKDLAEMLGVSEETARKRLSRAIERLRVIFARRGVAVSSVALAAAFAACGAQAAPGGLAASWAKMALAQAGAGTAATSGGGVLALLASAKSAGFLATVTGLAVLAAAAVVISKSISRGSPAPAPAATLTASPATPGTDPPASPNTSRPSAGTTAANPAASAALDKIKAALHDSNHTEVYPNPVMQAAVAGLGDRRKAALPVLETALNDTNAEVRLRAVDGLGLLGPEAKTAAPLLLGVLRDGGFGQATPQTHYTVAGLLAGDIRPFPIYTDNMILYALGQIHPAPEVLPEFAGLVKENRAVRNILYRATTQFGGVRRNLQAGGWLWELADYDAQALNRAFLPLLQDPDQAVRCVAALAVVSALGNQADAQVFSVAADLLKSGDDTFGRAHGMSILGGAAREPHAEASAEESSLTAIRLGPYLDEVVAGLTAAAAHTTRGDLRLKAAKLLDILNPDFHKSNPLLAADLDQQGQSEAFVSKVTSGEATAPEILDGLRKFPRAAPEIASYYARNGSNAAPLLPAFRIALAALAPPAQASPGDRRTAVRARQRLADAMQKLAPDLPKAIFTDTDTFALTRIMRDPGVEADAERLQRVSAARQSAEWPEFRTVGNFDVSPGEIRRLLSAMKDADGSIYDTLVARVKEVDPHFFDTAVESGKGN
jgi:RNA polymerase sigma factor (sigma-70 family)